MDESRGDRRGNTREIVTQTFSPYSVAVGVPAVVKKYRFDKEKIAELQATQWWEHEELFPEIARGKLSF